MNVKYINLISDMFFSSFASWTVAYVLSFFLGFSFSSLIVIGFGFMAVVNCFVFLYCYKDKSYEKIAMKEVLFLIFFIFFAVFITLCLNRPDTDNQLYLNVSISVLDYAQTPLKDIPLFINRSHVILPYELAKSFFTYVTGTPILVSYYLLLPAFLSIFIILVNFQLLRLFIGYYWIPGLIFFFIIMLAWGDIHRTYANFGFVRLFQGKAALVSIVVPGLFYYYFKFVKTLDKKYLVLLLMTMIAGCGFTATGIVVGPLILCILFLSGIIANTKNIKNHSILLLCLVIPIVLGLIMRFYFGIQSKSVHTLNGLQEHTTNIKMVHMIFGNGYRGWFAIFCFAVSPLFLSNEKIKKIYRNFVIICVSLLLFPWTSEIIAKMTYPTLSWRWLWTLPIPFSMSLVMGRFWKIDFHDIKKNITIRNTIALILIILFVFNSRPLVLSKENYTSIQWPFQKITTRNKIWLRLYKEYGKIEGVSIFVKSSNKHF